MPASCPFGDNRCSLCLTSYQRICYPLLLVMKTISKALSTNMSVGCFFLCFFKQTWLFLCGLACHPHSHNRFLGHYEKELWENSFQGDHFQKQCIRETVVFSFLVRPFLFDVILCEQRLSERLHLLQQQQINVRHKQHIYIYSPSTLRTRDGIF